MVDLHMHSTASDGSVPPAELPAMGARAKLAAMVLTDHDSVAGVPAFLAAAREAGIEALSGVELSTRFEFAEIHLIGYGVDLDSDALRAGLERIRTSRVRRNAKIFEVLSSLGLPLETSEVEALAGDPETTGRPHFAMAMVRHGYVADVREAFDRFLGEGRPAAVPRDRIEAVDGVRLLREAGGVVVWAHPRVGFSSASFRKILASLVGAGLEGVEAYHSNHNDTKVRDVRLAASERGLLVTGGSDFHGAYKPEVSLGRGNGDLRVPNECWKKLKERWEQRHS